MYSIKRKLQITQPILFSTGVWIPLARGVKSSETEISLKPNHEYKTEELHALIYKFKGLLPNKENIQINEKIHALPPAPPIDEQYLNSALNLQEPLISLDSLTSNEKFLANFKKNQIQDTVNAVIEYIVKEFKYEYPPKTREAQDVTESKRSDCGGYHSVFVGILRQLGIPSVMDFGARLPSCSPHVWAWWWDVDLNKWHMVDINDLQNGTPISDRVSFSLGTGITLPTFPRRIQFIQNFLIWDWNYDLHLKLMNRKVKADFELSII